jgi:hypothetical protein
MEKEVKIASGFVVNRKQKRRLRHGKDKEGRRKL